MAGEASLCVLCRMLSCAPLGRRGFLEDPPHARAPFLSVPPDSGSPLIKSTSQGGQQGKDGRASSEEDLTPQKAPHRSPVGFGLLKIGRCGKTPLQPSRSCLFPFPFSAHPPAPLSTPPLFSPPHTPSSPPEAQRPGWTMADAWVFRSRPSKRHR